jgi:phage FluMu protein Com
MEVKCPECYKVLAGSLVGGLLTIYCRRCKEWRTIDRRPVASLHS